MKRSTSVIITTAATLRTTTNTYTYNGQPLKTTMTEGNVTVITENTYDTNSGLLTATGGLKFHYYTQDYLGNNRAVINGTTGAIEQTVAYYPYGGVIPTLGNPTGGQPYKFGGKELITANDLNEYDFGARQYYSAVPGFTRIDQMAEKYPWLSPYLYCANNPVNYVDRDGKEVYVYATCLPGASSIVEDLTKATHTFIVVKTKDEKFEYFAFGSEFFGLRGAFGGKLCRQEYPQDKSIIKGSKESAHLLKAKIPIDVPEGMTQEEFDQKVIDAANSFGDNENIRYFMLPYKETQGNCNTSTTTILEKAGVSSEVLKELKKMIPGNNYGIGDVKPWTKEEQTDAVKRNQHNQNLLWESLQISLH